jgi:hypothetical protein
MPLHQNRLQFEPYRNSALFSSHWLESRLRLEPEWTECRADAEAALTQLTSTHVREGWEGVGADP